MGLSDGEIMQSSSIEISFIHSASTMSCVTRERPMFANRMVAKEWPVAILSKMIDECQVKRVFDIGGEDPVPVVAGSDVGQCVCSFEEMKD